MYVYLIQIVLILIAALVFDPNRNDQRKAMFLWFCFIVLVMVSGLRAFSVGSDTKEYVIIFNNVESMIASNTRFEKGFLYYVYIIKSLCSDPGAFLIVSSGICVGTVCVFVFKQSKDPVMSILLYVLLGSYFSQMNIMRQAIAASIGLFAFMIFDEKLTIRRGLCSSVFIVIAGSIHRIAYLLFAPLFVYCYLHRRRRFNVNRLLCYLILLSGALFLLYPTVMRVAGFLFPRYNSYFTGKWSDSNYFASLLNTLIAFAFLLFGSVVYRKKTISETQKYVWIMVAMHFLFAVLSMRMEIWNRVKSFFDLYTYLLWVPNSVNSISKYATRKYISVVVLLFSLAYMLIVLIFRPNWTLVVPYVLRY